MYYDRSKQDVYRILDNANFLNTLNGGSIEPQISVRKNSTEYHVRVTIPGIDEDKIRIEIAEKHLLVSHLMEFSMHNGKKAVMPNVIAACPLSLDFDHDRITADYHNGLIDIVLPLSDFTSGFRREIKLSK